MAPSSKNYGPSSWPLCSFVLHMLSFILIPVLMESNIVGAAEVGPQLTQFSALDQADVNDILAAKQGAVLRNITRNITVAERPSLPNMKSVFPSTTTTTPAAPPQVLAPEKEAFDDPYEPYVRGWTSPLGEYDLEYILDYYNEKGMIQEFDFDSMNIMKALVDAAMADKTPPDQFMEEIQDLITQENRVIPTPSRNDRRSRKEEQDENDYRDEDMKAGPMNENLQRQTTGDRKYDLKRLEKKYGVSSVCDSPDSVTPARLALMFPQYLNFGQRPFSAPSEVPLRSYVRTHTTANPEEEESEAPRSRPPSSADVTVPGLLKRPEFGGLIPLGWLRSLDDSERQALIGLHLYALYGNENDVVPFRTKCIMLRRRMQKNVLSDERRRRFLVNNEISDRYGSSVKTSLQTAYDKLPEDFKQKIDWTVFDVQNDPSAEEEPEAPIETPQQMSMRRIKK